MDLDAIGLAISGGMDVLDSDGEKLGEVADVGEGFLVVSDGLLVTTEYYVPLTAVDRVDESVHLTLTRDDALNLGWDQVPASLTTEGDEETPFADIGLHIDNPVIATASSVDELPDSAGRDESTQPPS